MQHLAEGNIALMAITNHTYNTAEWIAEVNLLAKDVMEWAKGAGWKAEAIPSERNDIPPGRGSEFPDTVLELEIETPKGKLLLEPMGIGLSGKVIVELYAWPTLYRVRLIRGTGDANWDIRTDSGISYPLEWNADTFVRLANDLLSAS